MKLSDMKPDMTGDKEFLKVLCQYQDLKAEGKRVRSKGYKWSFFAVLTGLAYYNLVIAHLLGLGVNFDAVMVLMMIHIILLLLSIINGQKVMQNTQRQIIRLYDMSIRVIYREKTGEYLEIGTTGGDNND